MPLENSGDCGVKQIGYENTESKLLRAVAPVQGEGGVVAGERCNCLSQYMEVTWNTHKRGSICSVTGSLFSSSSSISGTWYSWWHFNFSVRPWRRRLEKPWQLCHTADTNWLPRLPLTPWPLHPQLANNDALVNMHLLLFFFLHIVHVGNGLPGWLNSKESACNARGTEDTGLKPWVGKTTPCGRKWQPPPVFLLEKFHGQRSLSGCSPKGYKESDTTEQLSRHAKVRNINNWPIKIHFCLIPKPKKCPAPLSSSGAVLVYI